MVLRQIRFLHTPIKLIRADFESHTTNKKVVSSIQPNPTKKPGNGFAYPRTLSNECNKPTFWLNHVRQTKWPIRRRCPKNRNSSRVRLSELKICVKPLPEWFPSQLEPYWRTSTMEAPKPLPKLKKYKIQAYLK